MNSRKILIKQRSRRAKRTRAKISGSPVKPRLVVKRSNRFIYGQIINDENSRTLVSASSKELGAEHKKKNKTEQAKVVGEMLGKKAGETGIKQVVFDKRHYRYHGRVAALAEGVKKAGIKI